MLPRARWTGASGMGRFRVIPTGKGLAFAHRRACFASRLKGRLAGRPGDKAANVVNRAGIACYLVGGLVLVVLGFVFSLCLFSPVLGSRGSECNRLFTSVTP